MSSELVSIVVPFYKTGKDQFAVCMESLISQSYEDIEIIVVDDGSGSEYSDVLENEAQKDPRISIHNREVNQGLSAARNYGLKVSGGDYVIFIDSDDVVSKDMVHNLLKLSKDTGADLVIGELKAVSSYDQVSDKPNDINDNIILSTNKALSKLLTNNEFGSTACGRLAKKSVWLANGEDVFPVGKLHEDLGTLWKIFLKCSKVVFAKGAYYYYYQGDSSSIHTKKASIKFCEDFYNALSERNEFLFRECPDLTSETAFSYLMYCPLIYLFANDSEDKEWKKNIHKSLVKRFKDNYKTGKKYSGISSKQKVKLLLFYIHPKLYEISYKLMRKSQGYRA